MRMKRKTNGVAKMHALRKAISKVGTQTEFARRLPKLNKRRPDQRDVSKWLESGLPVKWVLHVEKLTGVPRHELAPEVYPSE